MSTVDTPSAAVPRWSARDLRMRRLLCLPVDAPTASVASAQGLVETSLLISASRCLLTYVFLPFLAPLLGLKFGIGPVLGIVVGVVAIVANVASVRRFWRADHRYRWPYTVLSSVIVVALLWLVSADIGTLLSL